MTHVKICGFQTAEPAIAAIEAGADSIGLVFVENARRRLTLEQGHELLALFREEVGPAAVEIVGLFADQPLGEVQEHIGLLGLDAVQLCGAEDVRYANQLSVPVQKVIGVDPQVPISAQMPRIMVLQQRHVMAGHRIVIDAKVANEYGGTGVMFDWDIAADLARGLDFSLAGGLTPDNVANAVATVKPWGVDTSSGVETDGVKDIEKVKAFIQAVRSTDQPITFSGALRSLLKRVRR
jgi:phosphoribosylanthranilate isomerase